MREEIRKRREKERRHKAALIKHKKTQKKCFKRWYERKKKEKLKQRNAVNDFKSRFMIIVTKDKKEIKRLFDRGIAWRSTAMKKYEEFLNENNSNVICHVVQPKLEDKTPRYELLLLRGIDPTEDDGIRQFRDGNERMVDTMVSVTNMAIIRKDEWFVPMKFAVYGYDPINDRKDGKWIMDNLLLQDEEFKRIMISKDKLIILHDNHDFDLVTTRTSDMTKHLYNSLMDACQNKDFLMFCGKMTNNMVLRFKERLKEKTGWAL